MRVLLVDDNALNLTVARGLLEADGLVIDGADAVDILQRALSARYTTVFMDLQMPGMDGIEAARLLRQQPRFADLPIIAMTANATYQDIECTRAVGMNHASLQANPGASGWVCLAEQPHRSTPIFVLMHRTIQR